MSAVITSGELSTPPDPSGWLAEFGELPQDETTQATFTIFHDMVALAASGSAFSNPLLSGIMGAFDQIALEVVTGGVLGSASVTLSVQMQHSGDGRTWINKRATPEILSTTLSQTVSTTLALGFEDGTIPSLAFVRFRFDFTSTAAFEVGLQATATCNNTREKAFTAQVESYLGGGIGNCTLTYPGGTQVWMQEGNFGDPIIQDAVDGGAWGTDFPSPRNFWWVPFFDFPEGYDAGSPPTGMLTLHADVQLCFHADGSMMVVRDQTVLFSIAKE